MWTCHPNLGNSGADSPESLTLPASHLLGIFPSSVLDESRRRDDLRHGLGGRVSH